MTDFDEAINEAIVELERLKKEAQKQYGSCGNNFQIKRSLLKLQEELEMKKLALIKKKKNGEGKK